MERELAFPMDEYGARLERVRAKMAERGLDLLLLLNPVSTKYLTGYQTSSVGNYQCLALPREGEPAMLAWELELPGVFLTSWISDAVCYRTGEDKFGATRQWLRERSLLRGTIGIEKDGRYVSGEDHDRLATALEGSRLVDGSGIVKAVLRLKSAREVVCLREAATITASGMRAALEAVAAGVTDNHVAAAASQTLIAAGGEFPCLSPIVTTGRRSGIPHTTHQRIRIEPGDAVLIEIGGCYHRYTAPLMRTVFVGQPPPGAEELAEAARTALERVMAVIRPGVPAEEVAAEGAGLLPLHDPSIIFHHTYGYSVGLGFPPTWADDGSLTLIRGNKTALEPGMVFHSTMSLRRTGRYGVAVSETLLVTDAGCEAITDFPRQFFRV
jgi:Xaa-Pro dipeptidase